MIDVYIFLDFCIIFDSLVFAVKCLIQIFYRLSNMYKSSFETANILTNYIISYITLNYIGN